MGKEMQQSLHYHQCHVVINEEGQYALWQFKPAPPAGWISVHSSNSEEECLEYISRNWTDILPNSLRK